MVNSLWAEPVIDKKTTPSTMMLSIAQKFVPNNSQSDTYLIAFLFGVLFPKFVILRLGALEGRVGHGIPCVVDANEQEQHRYRSDDEQGRYPLSREHNRRDDEGGVRDERQDRIPQPVGEHRLMSRRWRASQRTMSM